MVSRGFPCLSTGLGFCHIYYFLYSVVYYSFKQFACVAGEGYAPFTIAFSLCPFSFVNSNDFAVLPLFGYSFLFLYLVQCGQNICLVLLSASMNASLGIRSGPMLFPLLSFLILPIGEITRIYKNNYNKMWTELGIRRNGLKYIRRTRSYIKSLIIYNKFVFILNIGEAKSAEPISKFISNIYKKRRNVVASTT